MKIDALALKTLTDLVTSGQSAQKREPSGKRDTGSNVEAVWQDSRSSRDSLPSAAAYSPASLKAASARNALYPEVAENNLNAIRHNSPIPRALLVRLNSRTDDGTP